MQNLIVILRKIKTAVLDSGVWIFICTFICQRRYASKVVALQKQLKVKPNKKIRVGFLVNESAKWCGQSFCEALKADPMFEPFIIITIADVQNYASPQDIAQYIEKNYLFFKKNTNVEVFVAYHQRRFISLEQFQPDIIVYQHPWIISPVQNIWAVSKYALTVYFPYGFQPLCNDMNYMASWHGKLWKYFVDLPENIQRFQKYQLNRKNTSWKNYLFLGYPKMDIAYNAELPTRDVVIYAPHWSFGEFSTFHWSDAPMRELVASNPQIHWIFKPHPTLRYGLKYYNIMSEEEIDAYFLFWKQHAEFIGGGNYFSAFMRSSFMITDSVSFLGEYLCTGRPLIYLRNRHVPMMLNTGGETIVQNYYSAYNAEMLQKYFHNLREGLDPLMQKRCGAAKKFREIHHGASQRIISFLQQSLQKADFSDRIQENAGAEKKN